MVGAMAVVRTEIIGGVGILVLNNPDERNTLTVAMVDGIVGALDRFESDGGVGAVVVTGAGPAFCAGANLGNLAESTPASLMSIYEGFMRVSRCPLPTVAAVNGPAVGAGMNLALCCDVRIAGRRARFDTRFLQLGIHPGGGHTWMMRRAVGPQATAATVLFGEVLDAEEAVRTGLAWRCVDDGALMEEARTLAARAAAAPRELAIEVKRTIAAMAQVASHDDAVARELDPQIWSTRQPWFAERLARLQARISGR